MKSYLGDTYFKNMVNVSVPDIKLYKHKFNYILASDQIDHLSLIKMVNAAKSDEKIFQNLAEPLLDGQIELDSNWPDVNGYLGLISITLGGISFIGFIYICVYNLDHYKLHLWFYNKFTMYTVNLQYRLLFLKHQQQPRTVQFLIQKC